MEAVILWDMPHDLAGFGFRRWLVKVMEARIAGRLRSMVLAGNAKPYWASANKANIYPQAVTEASLYRLRIVMY